MCSEMRTIRFFSKLIAVPLLALVISCGTANLPTAPASPIEQQTPSTGETVPSTFRLSMMALPRTKTVGDQNSSEIETKTIGFWGGTIEIIHRQTKATFVVPPTALEQKTEISMQIHGEGPSAIIEFGPDGLAFRRPALLAISFPSEGVDPETLGGYLIEEGGTHQPVPHRILVGPQRITVVMAIAHFSEYSGNDGDDYMLTEQDLNLLSDEDIKNHYK